MSSVEREYKEGNGQGGGITREGQGWRLSDNGKQRGDKYHVGAGGVTGKGPTVADESEMEEKLEKEEVRRSRSSEGDSLCVKL